MSEVLRLLVCDQSVLHMYSSHSDVVDDKLLGILGNFLN